jgi:two-component system, cell cycle sensor histidine kinase and response regulator CckA
MAKHQPSSTRRRGGIPAHAALLSIACLLVPLAGSLLWREELGAYELLLWISALVPPFLLAFHRGWSGAAIALAAGMAALSTGHVALVWTSAAPISWYIPTAVGLPLILVSLGSAWLSERLWRLLLLAERNAAELSLVLDEQGYVVAASASAERLLGHAAAELEGSDLAEHVHVDDLPALSRLLRHAGQGSEAAELRLLHARGGYGTFEVVSDVARAWRGRNTRVLVARDIAVRKAAEERRRRTQTMRVAGRMVGVLAHETNNLLTSLNGHIDVLEQTVDPAELRRYHHHALQQSSRRVGSMIRQLVGFTQQSDLKTEPVFLNSFIQQRMQFFQKLLPEGVTLSVSFEDDGGFVGVDGAGLTEALTSIITNAAEATRSGDDVCIRVRRDTIGNNRSASYPYPVRTGEYIVAEIEDTGCGMSEEVLQRALDPFFTTHEKPGALGLGLSAAYGFIKQSGGYLWLRSTPGVGTGVSVYLPEHAVPPDTHDGLPSHPRGAEQNRFRTVLVVEDEPLVLSFIRSVLLRQGYSVLEATDGVEALEQYRRTPCDIVITDLRVPGLRGDELLLRLRAETPELPAVLTSGFIDREALDPRVFDGPTRLLDKPFSPPELLDAVTSVEEPAVTTQ